MSFEQIDVTRDGPIGRITLNRPAERNAMTPQMGREMVRAVETLNGDDDVRVVMITGAGKGFCSGADLRTLGAEAGSGDAEEGLGGGESFYRAFLSIRDLRVPSIAAINGHAVGAGFCFALGADLRVMHKDARVGMTFVRLGIHPGMAATWNLPRLIGPSAAADLLYTGRMIGADEALALGIANRIAGDDFDAVVAELASAIASAAPLAVRSLKQTLRCGDSHTIDEAIAREASEQAITFTTADAAEGIGAMREKRPPVFRGR
ncbi:MAG TPA: enoyl-CoA hydratase/isomerase family protein [Candidatus Limnocylindrales bacterium]|nr:enoyl-CoA hydratase/isomerase family protein [Candidatus Limnocylindrales bacterium]